jgi:hypothetical protein
MLGLLMSVSTITEAAEESKASLSSQFSEAYRSYTTTKNNGNKSEIHRYAMQALLLGELVYGEDYKNTGALAMNAALSYPTGWQGMPGADSLALIRKLVSRYESLFGPESADIVEPLLLLAEVLFAEGLVTNEDESRVQTRKRIENAEEELNQVSERIVKLLTEFNEELDTGAVLTRLSRIRIA